MNFILGRLQEKGTWTVILGAAAIFAGTQFSPEAQEKIITIGSSIVGLIIVLMKEKEVKKSEPAPEPQRIVTPDLTDEQRKEMGLD